MRIFDVDGPLMRVLTIIADLLWLNVLTLVCCIPVITTGASLTAMHYMALKIVRGEENHITASFFRSFKQNFKQSTVIWLIMLVVFLILAADIYIMYMKIINFPKVIEVIILLIAILVLFTFTFVFPVQAKFDNPVSRTLKNALVISILQFPKTIIMIVLSILPILMLFIVQIMPVALFFGISAPAYCFALMYNKFFKKLEDQIAAAHGEAETQDAAKTEDERIFHDELDEGISINENLH